jgi:hypothetical protein
MLLTSDSGKYILRSVVMRDLDLPESYNQVALEKLTALYRDVVWCFKSELGHF